MRAFFGLACRLRERCCEGVAWNRLAQAESLTILAFSSEFLLFSEAELSAGGVDIVALF